LSVGSELQVLYDECSQRLIAFRRPKKFKP
jgi:hypothetical protein